MVEPEDDVASSIEAPGEPEARDDTTATDEPVDEPWERPIDKFRRGAVGSVIAAGLLGVGDALEGRAKREDPPAVADAPEPKLDNIEIVLDPDHPENSRAIVYLPAPDDADDADD